MNSILKLNRSLVSILFEKRKSTSAPAKKIKKPVSKIWEYSWEWDV